MTRGFKITLAILGVFVAGVVVSVLHLQNTQLRRRLERQQPAREKSEQLHHENARMRALVADQTRDAQHATANLRGAMEQVRAEIAALEKAAAKHRVEHEARAVRDAEALATNRDPMIGFTRLEYFRELGQGTPTEAFQTMVRTALKGDEAALSRLFTVPPSTRAHAEALLSRLPESARAQWTPEKLAMLWVSGALLDLTALQITGQRFENPDLAVVTFRAPQFERDEKVNVKLTRDGWKIIVGTGMIGNLEKKLGIGSPARP